MYNPRLQNYLHMQSNAYMYIVCTWNVYVYIHIIWYNAHKSSLVVSSAQDPDTSGKMLSTHYSWLAWPEPFWRCSPKCQRNHTSRKTPECLEHAVSSGPFPPLSFQRVPLEVALVFGGHVQVLASGLAVVIRLPGEHGFGTIYERTWKIFGNSAGTTWKSWS